MSDYWGGTVANGNAFRSVKTFSRPADTTAYAAGDVIGASGASGATLQLPLVGPVGGVALISACRLRMSGTALPSGIGAFRLHLFSASPASAADNAAFVTTAGEMPSYIDYIDIPAPELIGGNFIARTVSYVGIPFQLVSSSLWAELVTVNAFTPVSAASFEVHLVGVGLGLQS